MDSGDNFWIKSPWKATKNWAIFIDRDGVINEEKHLAWEVKDLMLLPGVIEAVKKINQAGVPAIVVHNAAVIHRGLATPDQVITANQYLMKLLGVANVYLDAVLFCGHHPESFAADFVKDCDWQKPKPGMLLAAAKKFDLDLPRSYLVGDQDRDIAAGRAAGVTAIKTTNLLAAVNQIL